MLEQALIWLQMLEQDIQNHQAKVYDIQYFDFIADVGTRHPEPPWEGSGHSVLWFDCRCWNKTPRTTRQRFTTFSTSILLQMLEQDIQNHLAKVQDIQYFDLIADVGTRHPEPPGKGSLLSVLWFNCRCWNKTSRTTMRRFRTFSTLI